MIQHCGLHRTSPGLEPGQRSSESRDRRPRSPAHLRTPHHGPDRPGKGHTSRPLLPAQAWPLRARGRGPGLGLGRDSRLVWDQESHRTHREPIVGAVGPSSWGVALEEEGLRASEGTPRDSLGLGGRLGSSFSNH